MDSALEKVGIALDARGQVKTDHDFAPRCVYLWQSATCIKGPMLAHKAEDEGIAAAEKIAGQAGTSTMT